MAQFTSLALYYRRELILRLLAESTGAEGIIARTERGIAQKEGLRAGEEMTIGSVPDEPVEIVENGLTYRVDLRAGQKTGFYLDQRINRRAGRRLLPRQTSARPVLFLRRLLAQRGQARRSGGRARGRQLSRRDRAGRQHAAHQRRRSALGSKRATCSRSWSGSGATGSRFDVVICDPPKYARQAKDVEHALKGYLRLNLAALDVLEPDGVLVDLLVLGPGRTRAVRRADRRRGRAIRPADPDPGTTRPGARPPDLGKLPGDRVPEMPDLPGRR